MIHGGHLSRDGAVRRQQLASASAPGRNGARGCRRGDLLIPIIKGFCTESGIEIASVGIQVHGGMGYVEETGAAQTFRDARITSIYEGTTGIQSNDLIGRKVGRDRGAALLAFLEEMQKSLDALTPIHASRCRRAAQPPMRCADARSPDALLAARTSRIAHGRVRAIPATLWIHHRGWLMARAAVALTISRRRKRS
jgi:hypothetical protein